MSGAFPTGVGPNGIPTGPVPSAWASAPQAGTASHGSSTNGAAPGDGSTTGLFPSGQAAAPGSPTSFGVPTNGAAPRGSTSGGSKASGAYPRQDVPAAWSHEAGSHRRWTDVPPVRKPVGPSPTGQASTSQASTGREFPAVPPVTEARPTAPPRLRAPSAPPSGEVSSPRPAQTPSGLPYRPAAPEPTGEWRPPPWADPAPVEPSQDVRWPAAPEPTAEWRPPWAEPSGEPAAPGAPEPAAGWRPSRDARRPAAPEPDTDWEPWADSAPVAPSPDPGGRAMGEPARSWDPLVDPLPGGLDPLPAPDPAWPGGAARARSDASEPSAEQHNGRSRHAEPGNAARRHDDRSGLGFRERLARADDAPGSPRNGFSDRAVGDPWDRYEHLAHRSSSSGDAAARGRPGRRRAQEALATTAEGRHSADAPSARHGDVEEPRHADTGGHAVPRVPPTQWAWPKEPEPASAHTGTLAGRRAADGGGRPAAWAAADLLDVGRHSGGRRRRSDPPRHGASDDPDAGRHHRH